MSASFTFQQEWHERQDGRLKFADGNAISTVVPRRLDEAVELAEHFAQLSRQKWQQLSNDRPRLPRLRSIAKFKFGKQSTLPELLAQYIIRTAMNTLMRLSS